MKKHRHDIPDTQDENLAQDENPPQNEPKSKGKRHLIHPTWLRRTLKISGVILLVILMIPVLVYIPPVQTLLKDTACSLVRKSTGMDVRVDKFRLKFPLDISLRGVSVVEASGDTMVRAREAIADVKLLPLLHLDVRLNRLQLIEGYYRMVSPDSSMIMALRAGRLEVDGQSSANLSNMDINLNKAVIDDGNLSLYMNVWKKIPSDTVSPPTQMRILADDLQLNRFTFAMSMLPTIDSLQLQAGSVHLIKGVVDLGKSSVKASSLAVESGKFSYIAPDPEYVKAHPAPVDTISPPSPPMTIQADSVSLSGFDVLYATKGVKPAPGFDPSYISMTEVDIALSDFFNEASTVRLPITRLKGRERSGLTLVSGQGTVGIDSIGLTLNELKIATPYSRISASANVPFAMMALDPSSPMACDAEATVGIPDIESFMPAVRNITSSLSRRDPLNIRLTAKGSLASIDIPRLDAALPGVLSLRAKGYADNALDFKRLKGSVDIDGELRNPQLIERIIGPLGFRIPAFRIKGVAGAASQTYTADLDMVSEAGDIAADARVSLTAESYNADVTLHDLDAAWFAPQTGVGKVTATVRASGAGFNPTRPGAALDADVIINSIDYNNHILRDITVKGELDKGVASFNVHSPNEYADLDIDGSGSINGDNYTFDVTADIRNADLKALGVTADPCGGQLSATLRGTANPSNWLYDATFDARRLIWTVGDRDIDLPEGVSARFTALPESVDAHVESLLTYLDFKSGNGLRQTVDAFTATADSTMVQIKRRNLDVEALAALLPDFSLDLYASGQGLVRELLTDTGLSLDTVYANISKDSIITARVGMLDLNTGSLKADTLTLDMRQRGSLFNYLAHMGNRPGTFDEFANVDVRGYIGSNRASLFLNQRNIKNETGYRLGLTAAVMDSTVSLHFTPLKSTIAYMPWTFNTDNHVDYHYTGRIDANLMASSRESSILMKTEPDPEDGAEIFHLNLDNIKIEDFLSMSAMAPPIKASVNSDLRIKYNGHGFSGGGTLDIADLYYERKRVGDFNMDMDATYDLAGHTSAKIGLKVDGRKALEAHTVLTPDSTGRLEPEDLGLTLTRFPLKIANPFLGPDMVALGGYLNGEMDMGGTFTRPVLNGHIMCDSVRVTIPMTGSTLSLDNDPLDVSDNIITLKDFKIKGVNDNPMTANGKVNVSDFSNVLIDLDLNARNFQLIGNDKRAKSQIYGKLFLDLQASAKGSTSRLDINATADILGKTDIFYTLATDPSAVTTANAEDVVRFVNLSDTTSVAKADSVAKSMDMRIDASLTLSPGMQATVNITPDGQSKAQLHPSGTLNFFQNYMGDMRLNGQLYTGEGLARYSIPIVGMKSLNIEPQSSVTFNGDIMNPSLNIKAYDTEKINVSQTGGNSRLVNFLISLNVSNTLQQPKVVFDLSTDDDMTVQNEISSMSADQRSTQAMNIFLYGQYSGPGTKTLSAPGTNTLYSFLSSSLNKWAAQNIRGVDLSFGIDEYDKQVNGQNSTAMTYSYQVSKSLFNNKFKIVVGGNYSTDASADENFAQNLVSDISFEYMIKQTNSLTMLAKLFRHSGYESILEGEVTETGVGFVMSRRLSNLRWLFNFGRSKMRRIQATQPKDSTAGDSIAPPTLIIPKLPPSSSSGFYSKESLLQGKKNNEPPQTPGDSSQTNVSRSPATIKNDRE